MTATHETFMAGLLPGNDIWPCAADLDLTPHIERLLCEDPVAADAWAAVGGWALPDRGAPEDVQKALRQYESTDPESFASAMLLVYAAYYTHPRILDLIEGRSGYPARPPQPVGHPVQLDGPDPIPATAASAPLWRADGTTRGRQIRSMQSQDPERIWTEEEIAAWPMS